MKLPGLDALHSAWSALNDAWMRIETSDLVMLEGCEVRPRHCDDEPYQAANYSNIRRIIRTLNPNLTDIVYDVGCGKGRCVCMFAQKAVQRVVGIEYNPRLCSIAGRNASQVRGRRSPIVIRCEDAAAADVADGTIYFFYNPFGMETLNGVLERIHDSLRTNPRLIRLVYYNPIWENVFSERPWLHRTGEFRTLTNRRVTFWRNRL